MNVHASYQTRNGGWIDAGRVDFEQGLTYRDEAVALTVRCERRSPHQVDYRMSMTAAYPTRIKLEGVWEGAEAFHLIPCCIHGDNNLQHAKPDQYPNLTREFPESRYSSPVWEFRADRASHPVSILCTAAGVAAISIDPYTHDAAGRLVRNGVFAELPDRFGVTLGYANIPFTFVNKRDPWSDGTRSSTSDPLTGGEVAGSFFLFAGAGREAVKSVIDTLYRRYRECPKFQHSVADAARALLDAFVNCNYSEQFGHYTNQEAHPPKQPELKPWRALLEIGWTGGSILANPFIAARRVLGLPPDYFDRAKSGETLFDEIVAGFNPASGMFFDLVRELNGSRVNGWWDFLKITHDCHSAYTNGHALYYLALTMAELRKRGAEVPELWRSRAAEMTETLIALQREDGCCGYSFRTDRKEVADFDGFAGCWMAAAMMAYYRFSGEAKVLAAAERAAHYYHPAVARLNVCGTPMDTWKAPDQEGNIAFIKLTRMLHEATGKAEYLDMLADGARYEYLWRYAIKAEPEIMPLLGSGWNSCGGSVTSVSNPHIHPMGVLVTPELYYLAERTGDEIHRMRAEDGVAWMMNSLELYPQISGYGRYGVTTERFCPSDGLTLFFYSDGRPSSMWYSYNGWAAANALEALLYMVEFHPRFQNR